MYFLNKDGSLDEKKYTENYSNTNCMYTPYKKRSSNKFLRWIFIIIIIYVVYELYMNYATVARTVTPASV